MSNGWKYTGTGERVSYGVPTRDLSAEEFGRLNPLDQRHVLRSDLYRELTDAEIKKQEAAAKKAEEDVRKAAEVDAKKQEGGDS